MLFRSGRVPEAGGLTQIKYAANARTACVCGIFMFCDILPHRNRLDLFEGRTISGSALGRRAANALQVKKKLHRARGVETALMFPFHGEFSACHFPALTV